MVRKISVVSMRGTLYLMYLVGLMAGIGVGRATAALSTEKERRGIEVLDAAKVGNYFRAQAVLGQPGDVDVNIKDQQNGNTILHYAAAAGHVDIAQFVLSKGANVNAKNNNGAQPIHNAIREQKTDMVKLLIKNGANVNFQDTDMITWLTKNVGTGVNFQDENKNTVLHQKAAEGDQVWVELLLKNGADANATDNQKITPLHHAANNGHLNVVKLLVEQGKANVNLMSVDCRTPLNNATDSGKNDVRAYLRRKGAKLGNVGAPRRLCRLLR